jgi:hypothetical protein
VVTPPPDPMPHKTSCYEEEPARPSRSHATDCHPQVLCLGLASRVSWFLHGSCATTEAGA